MDPILSARLPVNLESAVQRVRMAARTAAERTVDSLGLAAMSSNNVFQRDSLLGAQFELNRKLAIFALTFNDTLDTRIARELGVSDASTSRSGIARWDALSLVDDHEVEIQLSADRFALEISHSCEWEIRELDAYIGPLLNLGRIASERNPLRAEVIGQVLIRAVESVADRPEVSKVLATEIGRSLALAMRQTYLDIVADLRKSGITPAGLSVRQRPDAGRNSGPGHLDDSTGHSGHGQFTGHGLTGTGRLLPRGANSRPGHKSASGPASSAGGFSGSADGGQNRGAAYVTPQRGGDGSAQGGSQGPGAGERGSHGNSMGRVDGEMMSLIRRLSHAAQLSPDTPAASHVGGSGDGVGGEPTGTGTGTGTDTGFGMGMGMGQLMAPNLIVAHRDELRQAAAGTIDHMVIDVIAGLFDQILSDPKVPPQMARQIGRLQLPVLRAALGDSSFFSSRRHPVRRFINRIASLGSAVEDFDGEDGLALLARVRELVQDIVDGDFDQIELYEQQLHALEAFIAEQAKAQLKAGGAADRLLARKEDLLRIQQRYALQLDGALQPLPVAPFLREFLGQVWSRVIAGTELDSGADSAMAKRMREVGRELVMSLQPKGVPEQRALFLRQLPQLMKDLNAGLDRIRCSDAVRRDFFAQLMPAQAESLKAQALSTLERNLLSRQVQGVLATPLPKTSELPPTKAGLPVLHDAVRAADFSPAEAKAVGLVDEASVDWNGMVDIDLTAEAELSAADIDIAGLPCTEASEPVEPMRGKSLADHVQIGFAYQMNLAGAWQKVRMAHVSAARTFFVFTHGAKQRKTISMTYRMLSRMCETGRMRAFENAYLIERATARARRQLAQLNSPRQAS